MGNFAKPDLRVVGRPGNVSPVMMFHNSGKIEKLVLQENRNDDRLVDFLWSGGYLFHSFLNGNQNEPFPYEPNRANACNHT
jgi:hypothetical protein